MFDATKNRLYKCMGRDPSARACAALELSIVGVQTQHDDAVRELEATRSRLRLAHTNGAAPTELRRGIEEVNVLRHRVKNKTNVLRNLEAQRGHLEDVHTNTQVMEAMRSTNGALKDAYRGVDEDTALDLTDEFDDFAETHNLTTGALGPTRRLDEDWEEEEDDKVDEAALAAAMGLGPSRQRGGALHLPTAPGRDEAAGATGENGPTVRVTKAARSEIRALRL